MDAACAMALLYSTAELELVAATVLLLQLVVMLLLVDATAPPPPPVDMESGVASFGGVGGKLNIGCVDDAPDEEEC